MSMSDYRYPLISVIVPSYNHASYVREAVESVWTQDYPNLELVVVDDLSTDGSRDILIQLQDNSPIPFQLHLNDSNLGPVLTVNLGILKAHGDLIVPFASDDKFLPRAFSGRAQLFQMNKNLKVLFSNGRFLHKDGHIGKRLHNDLQKRLLAKSPQEILEHLYTNSSTLFLQTALIRRAFLAKCGSYDDSVLADDWAMTIRMFQNMTGKDEYAFIDNDVFLYRIHGGNLNRNFERHISLKCQMVEKYTPPHLRRRAMANIYWEIGHSLIGIKPFRSLRYMLVSQLVRPQPQKILTTLKVVVAAFMGRMLSRW